MEANFDIVKTESTHYAEIVDSDLGFDGYGNFYFRLHLKNVGNCYMSVTFGLYDRVTDKTDEINKLTLSALKELLDMVGLLDFKDLKGKEVKVKTLDFDYVPFRVISIMSLDGGNEINLSIFNQYF